MMDKENRKIGIIGYWFATNYGGVASYYSLCEMVKTLGHHPVLIENPYFYTDKEGEDVFSRNLFKDMGIEICEPYTNDELEKLNEKFETFLLGSDQVLTTSSIKAYGKLFLMEFSEDEKKRIAISASCGGDNLNTDDALLKYAQTQLMRFSKISVREYAGTDVLRRKLEINADLIIDPIFFTQPDTYEKIGNLSGNKEEEPYLLAYILDPTPDKREGILRLSRILGMKFKIILDGRKFTHESNEKAMGLPEQTLPELDFNEWISYYVNASFVITDSFHGAAMSLILNKNFIAFSNYKRGYPRFLTLFRMFELKNRLIENSNQITYELVRQKIDFDKINGIREKEVEKAKQWLENALESDEKSQMMVPSKCVNALLDKNKCVGCGACVNICPKDAIVFETDEWGYYRSYVNVDQCIDCGKCSLVCPVLHTNKKMEHASPECYEFIAKNKEILKNSSSGGIFSVISNQILDENGIVAGAAWNDDFSVKHILIDSKTELYKLQRSKYLQSYIGNSFRDVKVALDENKKVLFTGCPCQVAGLYSYLEWEYENLFTIDLLCGNAPSTGFFKKYVQEQFGSNIKNYSFRSKARGYNAECIEIENKDGSVQQLYGMKEDPYQKVYHNHTMCPEHCERCLFQMLPRYGDLTIGDFWGISRWDKEINTREGVSVVLCNSPKGKQLLKKIPESEIDILKKVPLEWLGGNGYAIKNSHNYCSPVRDLFYDAIQKMDFSKAVTYALKPDHGIYHASYENVNTPLMLNSKLTTFSFDSNVWEEHVINGKITLIVKPNEWKVKRYANLALARPLKKYHKYMLEIRFKVRTAYHLVTFHVRESGSGCIQIITSFNIPSNNTGEQWYTVRKEFYADTDSYDQFMIGASQISGAGNYFMIDYINIFEETERSER